MKNQGGRLGQKTHFAEDKLCTHLLEQKMIPPVYFRDYFMPTEESLSAFGGTELPGALPVKKVFVVEFGGNMGLDTGGLREFVPIKGLDATLGKPAAALLGGKACELGRAGPDIPNRVAIICALSWKSLCFDRSNCSLTRIATFSISVKKANFVSSLYN